MRDQYLPYDITFDDGRPQPHPPHQNFFEGGPKKKKVKTGPMDLEFGMETKFDMENMKIKEKFEIDTYLINCAWFVKTGPMDLEFGMET